MYEIASGTVTGRDHVIAGKNNQDHYSIARNKDVIVTVVTDGCSGERFSEVGAHFGAAFLSKRLSELISSIEFESDWSMRITLQGVLRLLTEELLGEIFSLAEKMSQEPKLTIQECFLFTVVAACVTPKYTAIFSCGDGVFAINGGITILKNEVANEPAYIAYRLLSSRIKPELTIKKIIATPYLDSLLIGTDGLLHFIKSENKKMPKSDEPVGPISEFWTNEKYFKNPDMVRRKLALSNSVEIKPDWDNQVVKKDGGYLPDDTTLVVLRRQREDQPWNAS